ncbi:hypothetical protein BH24ACT5_BH24ACT5_12440 [soil metagenome]
MLRASAHATGQHVDLRAVTRPAGDPLITAGTELLRFATSLVADDVTGLSLTSDVLLKQGGADALVRAAAVAGNFQMMNRLVDATGVPIGASMRTIAADLGLAEPL